MLLGLQGMVLGLTGCTDYEGVGRDQLAAPQSPATSSPRARASRRVLRTLPSGSM